MALTEHIKEVKYAWGETRRIVEHKRDLRYAGKDELFMRCGRCGKTDFTLIVKITGSDTAELVTAACTLCNKTFPFYKGQTGGKLEREEANARQREEINVRPETDASRLLRE